MRRWDTHQIDNLSSDPLPLSRSVTSFRCAARRLRPALDGHEDAAAEGQFGTDEFSIIEETVTHNGQGRPKLLIFVTCEVHVVNDEDAATAKCGHSPAQLEDLPAGRVREYQVKLAEAASYQNEPGPCRPGAASGSNCSLTCA